MSDMVVIKPVSITTARLLSSNVVETSAEWSSLTTYALDDRASVSADGRVYQSLQAGNLNNVPSTATAWWVDVGPSNRLAMFDGALGTVTTDATSIVVELAPGAISAIAVFEAQCASVRVHMYDADTSTTVYDETVDMTGTLISDWYEWTVAPFDYRDQMVLLDLPIYESAVVTVTLTGDGILPAECGELIVGTSYTLGEPQHGGKLGITDYSRKETDDWGNTTLVQRTFSRNLDMPMVLDAAQLNRVYGVLSMLRSTPCVWVPSGEQRYDSTVVYGWVSEFVIDLAMRDRHYCTLNIKGLT